MFDECDSNERRISACDQLHLGMDDMRLTTAIHPQYLPERRELFKRASPVFIDANIPEKTLRTA
jgi:hypothetical protein